MESHYIYSLHKIILSRRYWTKRYIIITIKEKIIGEEIILLPGIEYSEKAIILAIMNS